MLPIQLLVLPLLFAEGEWKPAPAPLLTRFAAEVTPENAHREYPRPQMVRERWQCLNGLWDYAIRPAREPEPEQPDGKILVPFPLESALSGVGRRLAAGEALHYRCTFAVPWEEPLLLHFGAVDYVAAVTVETPGAAVSGQMFRGGYTPFSLRLPAAPAGTRRTLSVTVTDPTDAQTQPRGKQVREPEGIWYTPTSGIWQSVWVEPVPDSFIETLRIEPDLDHGSVRVRAFVTGGAARIHLRASDGAEAEGAADSSIELKLKQIEPWSPDHPHLYGLDVELRKDGAIVDAVKSDFGLRKVSLGRDPKDPSGALRVLLNNEFVFQYGPLDQGFWPDGLYTPPSDAALVAELETVKRLGFNMLRKHVKVESARFYHHCDELGILVWQDMPSGDASIGPRDADIQRTPESAREYERELAVMIEENFNSPSIIGWVPFNEGWGQFDTARIAAYVRELDPTRLVDCPSGWTDRGKGDVHDVHVYPGPGMPPNESARAAMLGEFGGLGLPLEGHTWVAKGNWGYVSYADSAALTAAYLELVHALRDLVEDGLSVAVYTQLTDVEREVNGLLTYDRARLKMDERALIAAHAALRAPMRPRTWLAKPSALDGSPWRMRLETPPDGWITPGFDDSSWPSGKGGFGTDGTPGAVVGTRWDSSDVWLRRTFALDAAPSGEVELRIHHDEDAEVYLNGVLAAKLGGYTVSYVTVAIAPEARATLKAGENVMAVHCHQTRGGQFIDAGLRSSAR